MKLIPCLLSLALSATLHASNTKPNFYLVQGEAWKFNPEARKYIVPGPQKISLGERNILNFSKNLTDKDNISQLNESYNYKFQVGSKISFTIFLNKEIENLDEGKVFELPKRESKALFDQEEISVLDITNIKLDTFKQRIEELQGKLEEKNIEFSGKNLPDAFSTASTKERFVLLEEYRKYKNELIDAFKKS